MSTAYRVRVGDTLSRIAAVFRTTVARLAAANRVRDADRIRAGQVLQVPGPPAAAPLGLLSRKYEVGGCGPGTVSTGRGDRGGVSYGSYQLASRYGRPAEFLAAEGQPWRARFGAAVPGSPEFSACWQACAAADPVAFEAAQHAFIERTHYAVQAALLRRKAGLDLARRSRALQEAVWSTAVQHGPTTCVVLDALAALGRAPGDPQFDRALITALYTERGRCLPDGTLAYFKGNSRPVQASVARRLQGECRDCLALLGP
ncbi:MAG: LysM peptidoglycan-binding domain-containing protein [Croceibacterium sp.]